MLTKEEFLKLTESDQVEKMLVAIAAFESGGGDPSKINYQAVSRDKGAGGAYQFRITYWPGFARGAGEKEFPALPQNASKAQQDRIARYYVSRIFKQYGAARALIIAPLTWFYPAAAQEFASGNEKYIDQKAPGDNGGLTFRDYVNRVWAVLFGKELTSTSEPTSVLVLSKVPLSLGASGPDVVKLEEFLNVALGLRRGIFGTLLQYYVIGYQRTNKLKITGVWDKESNDSVNSSFDNPSSDSSGSDDDDLDVARDKSRGPVIGLDSTTTVKGSCTGSIIVAKSIAKNVQALLDAVCEDGISGVGGGGYRTSAGQIAVRKRNCGSTQYDIYEKPSGSCKPPTARPGSSMHERGEAIDFTLSGKRLGKNNVFYNWLVKNASKYGLYNFPKESWHWSTNGS